MTNILNALTAQTDWAILVVRLAVGLVFVAHGWQKIKNYKQTVAWFQADVLKPGWLWATLSMTAEFVGGLLLILGLCTQPAALILAINISVALTYRLRKKHSFVGGYELDLTLLVTLLLLATLGSGFFALNNLFAW